MQRARYQSSAEGKGRKREDRVLSDTIAQVGAVVRHLNRIASRMDRMLAARLRRLEILHQ